MLISDLIILLEKYEDSFYDYENLIRALKELNSMIGMTYLKESITKQIMYLIKNKNFNVMLNTVIYGPPGTGKSRIGKILCKIWTCIGIIGQKEFREKTHETSLEDPPNHSLKSPLPSLTESEEFESKMAKSQEDMFSLHKRLIKNLNIEALSLERDLINLKSKIDPECSKLVNDIINKLIEKIFTPTTLFLGIRGSKFFDDQETDTQIPLEPIESNFVTVSREDFVGLYVGHTANKTLELLKKYLGKVIFIDEAYSLFQDERDTFGLEALTTLNLFMSQNPSTIIIFAGYKHLLEETIFKAQPGLQGRCTWVHEIDPYTPVELYNIFKYQLEEEEWFCNEDLSDFFKKNKNYFPGQGRDTKKLIFYSKLEHSEENFTNSFNDLTLTKSQILKGLDYLKKNQTVKNDFVSMYHM